MCHNILPVTSTILVLAATILLGHISQCLLMMQYVGRALVLHTADSAVLCLESGSLCQLPGTVCYY